MRSVSATIAATLAALVVSSAGALAADIIRPPVVPVRVLAPGLVHAGMVDAWYGWRSVESTQDPNGNHSTAGINGYASLPLGPNLSVQLDGQYERYFDNG